MKKASFVSSALFSNNKFPELYTEMDEYKIQIWLYRHE